MKVFKKSALVFLLYLLSLVISFSSFAGEIKEKRPLFFRSNGSNIMGWYWLRSYEHYAEWRFLFPFPQFQSPVVLCFSTLSTNRTSGGAGYDSFLKLEWPVKCKSTRVHLKNAWSCLKNLAGYYYGDSHGIGYLSYGCVVCNSLKLIPVHRRSGPARWMLRVVVKYTGGHHTAVRQSSLRVVYTTP